MIIANCFIQVLGRTESKPERKDFKNLQYGKKSRKLRVVDRRVWILRKLMSVKDEEALENEIIRRIQGYFVNRHILDFRVYYCELVLEMRKPLVYLILT